MTVDRGDVTVLLAQWRAGNSAAANKLLELTYSELRRLARAYFRHERPGHTLQPTALLNEACLRLLPKGPLSAENRQAFFRLMAAEIRRRLIDHARKRRSVKRGLGVVHETVDQSLGVAFEQSDFDHQMLDKLDGALERLRIAYPRTAQVVQLRFIAGLPCEQVAHELGLSTGTVKRDWAFAKAWLAAAIEADEAPP